MSKSKLRVSVVTALAVPLVLALGAAPASAVDGGISGTVTGPGGGNLSGIPVRVYSKITEDPNDQELLAQTTTDGDGDYSVPGLNGNTVVVCFESDSYVKECWNGEYDDEFADGRYGDDVVVDADGVQNIDASLIVGSSISGKLTTDEGGNVSGALVTALEQSAIHVYSDLSDADGEFTLDHLEPGTYKICVVGTTIMKRCTGDVGGPATFTVDEDDVVTGVDLEFVARPNHMRVAFTGADKIRWAWDAVPGATSYKVAVSTSPTMSRPQLRSVTGTWATFAGLTPGKTYYAAVRGQSSEALGFAPATTARSAIVAARPGVVSALRVTGATLDSLTWSWAAYVGADNYIVRLSSSPTFAGYRLLYGPTTSLTFEDLEPGKTYYATVRALHEGKALTAYSPVKSGATAD